MTPSKLAALTSECSGKPAGVAARVEAVDLMRLLEERARLLEALDDGTEHWCEMASSGDAGCWDPENDDHIISARAALALALATEPTP